MPGRGRVEPSATGTLDIYLNDNCCWRGVPEEVLNYSIGGYQVLKKWLSYREKPLLGRALLPDEVRHFTHTAHRLAALIALHIFNAIIEWLERIPDLRLGYTSDS